MQHELGRLADAYGWNPHEFMSWDDERKIWNAPGVSLVKSAFSEQDSRELSEFMDLSWWAEVRSQIILKAITDCGLRPTLWDIGGGSGYLTKYLNDHGIEAICVEPSIEGALAAGRRGVATFLADVAQMKLPESSLNSVGMFDVLEHISDRHQILQEIHRIIKPDGHLIITVPALESLRGHFDCSHYLRYNKPTIRNELTANRFEIVKLGYFFCLTVVPIFILRALPYKLGFGHKSSNRVGLSARGGSLERLAGWIERSAALRTPVGSSLLVVAKKTQ